MNSPPTFLLAGLLSLSPFCCGLSVAQNDANKKPNRVLRILPLGETPPFVFKQEGGARVEADAPAGSIPPRQIVQVTKNGEERGNPLPLRLGQISAPTPATGGTVSLHAVGSSGPEPKAWHALRMPGNATHALALLWRDPDEKKWTKAHSLSLADDLKAFPPGMVRFVNVSTGPATIEFSGETIELEPGNVALRGTARAAIEGESLQVKVSDAKGKAVRVHAASLSHTAEERTNVIIYKADGKRPRRPAKVFARPERAKLATPPRGR